MTDQKEPEHQPLVTAKMLSLSKPFNRRLMIGGGVALILVAAVSVALVRYRTGSSSSVSVTLPGTLLNTESPAPTTVASDLDGTQVDPKLANRRPLAIMVENHPDARPQYGLADASVVYEAVAEGGITRFMAVYGPKDNGKVGPVRSARTYYLDWALEYDAGYAHVGGNIDALDLIPSLGINNLDQFAIGSAAFRREAHDGVATEHTMYTDTGKLRSIMDKEFGGEPKWTKPSFKESAEKEKRGAAATITVSFSGPLYKVGWAYDPETNRYSRTMAGEPHKDGASGEPLKADNVIVQTVQARPILTRINEPGVSMTTVGEGKATIYQDGQAINGSWKKANHNAPTEFRDDQGQLIKRNPGVTWIEVIQPDMTVITS